MVHQSIDFAPSDLKSQYNSIKTTIGEQWQLLTVDSWDETHFKPTKTTLTASGSACSHISESTFNTYGLTSSIAETGPPELAQTASRLTVNLYL